MNLSRGQTYTKNDLEQNGLTRNRELGGGSFYAEYRIQDTEYRIQNTEYRIQIQNTGYRIQDTEYRIQNTGYRIQEVYHYQLLELMKF